MTYVVDASVAAKWFLRAPLHDQALALLGHVELLAAPDLIVTEVTNIAGKKTVRGDIGRAQAQAMAAAIRHYVPTLQPSTELAEQALDIALALNHPATTAFTSLARKPPAGFWSRRTRRCASPSGGPLSRPWCETSRISNPGPHPHGEAES